MFLSSPSSRLIFSFVSSTFSDPLPLVSPPPLFSSPYFVSLVHRPLALLVSFSLPYLLLCLIFLLDPLFSSSPSSRCYFALLLLFYSPPCLALSSLLRLLLFFFPLFFHLLAASASGISIVEVMCFPSRLCLWTSPAFHPFLLSLPLPRSYAPPTFLLIPSTPILYYGLRK